MVWTRDNCSVLDLSVDASEETYHLLCNHDHSLYGEPTVAVIEEVFQAGSEKIDDEDVVQAFLAKVVHIRDSSYALC